MTASSSAEAQEWLTDYQGRLEAARHEWTSASIAKIKSRPLPEGQQEEPAVFFLDIPHDN
jgi:hypothetical protein